MNLHVAATTPAEQALPDAAAADPGERISVNLALAATAPRQARRLVDAALAEWGLGHLADAADLITSELVTNALIHGDDPAHLTVYTDRRADGGLLFVEVADSGGELPMECDADDEQECGRGLQIVAAMAEDWGFEKTPDGKYVWASIAIEAT